MSESVTTRKDTDNEELHDVQSRLMRMLDSVCLDPNETPKDRPAPRNKKATATSTTSSKSSNGPRVKVCPNCRSEESWGDSSWCPACGYYPSLKRKVFSDDLVESEVEEEEEDLDLQTMATMVPMWIYFLGGGLLVLLVESLAIRLLIPSVSRRSSIAIVQVLVGLNVLGISHIRAYFIAANEDENFNIISIFWSPFEIWKTVFTQMPRVYKTVCGGTWGLAAVLFAVAFIGIDYANVMAPLTQQRRKPVNPIKTVLKLASGMASTAPAQRGPAPDSIEDALKNFAGDDLFDTILDAGNVEVDEPLEDAVEDYQDDSSDTQSASSPSNEETAKVEKPKKTKIVWSSVSADGPRELSGEYIVIGFITNASGQLRSLLIAEILENSGAVRFAGKYTINTRDKKFIEKLQEQLSKYRTRTPAMKTPYIAKWTAPYVHVKISHNGMTPDGRVRDGHLVFYKNKGSR